VIELDNQLDDLASDFIHHDLAKHTDPAIRGVDDTAPLEAQVAVAAEEKVGWNGWRCFSGR